MEQLQLFNDKEYLDTSIELKNMIKAVIEKYEDENSWLYNNTEMIIEFIKMIINY